MSEQLQRGQQVTAISYGGERLRRMVVADLGRRVLVCTEEEYRRAEQENREPDSIGFLHKDIQTTT